MTTRNNAGSKPTPTIDCMITKCTGVHDGLIDGEAVIFSALDRRLHVLNRTARQTWEVLRDGATGHQVIAALAVEHGMHPHDIAPDVLGLIEQLSSKGLCHLDAPCDHGLELAERSRDQRSVGNIALVGSLDDEPIGPLRAMGVPIIVETNDVLLRSELSRVLGPLRRADVDLANPADASRLQHIVVDAVDNRWHVARNGDRSGVAPSREAAIRMVVAECNTAPLVHIDDAVVFHAAAADLGRGNVLLAGISNAGKSTLVAQLAQRGHRYLTDEASAVDVESLAVRPFPKSICLEAGAHALFPELAPRSGMTGTAWDVDPRTLGPGRLGDGGPILAVVYPTFDPTADHVLRPLDKLDALRRSIANSFVFDHVGAPAFEALVRMANVLPSYELIHRGGTRHLDQLEDLFGETKALSL